MSQTACEKCQCRLDYLIESYIDLISGNATKEVRMGDERTEFQLGDAKTLLNTIEALHRKCPTETSKCFVADRKAFYLKVSPKCTPVRRGCN